MPRKKSEHRPKEIEEFELELALRALRTIKNHGGLICDNCAEFGFGHKECWASYQSWNVATNTLARISEHQRGEYTELK